MTNPHDPAHAFTDVDIQELPFVIREDGERFAEEFSNFCNDMRKGPKSVALEKMMREHRTIQQNMMRFCLAFIAKMADQNHDFRNEASVKLAKEIMERTEYESRALPYI